MNVLIIEDDVPLAHNLAALMQLIADRVTVAHSLHTARKALDKPNGFHIVFLDLNLPDSETTKTMEDIKWIKGTGRRVVVITNAKMDLNDFLEISGADACFFKYDPDFKQSVISQLRGSKSKGKSANPFGA